MVMGDIRVRGIGGAMSGVEEIAWEMGPGKERKGVLEPSKSLIDDR